MLILLPALGLGTCSQLSGCHLARKSRSDSRTWSSYRWKSRTAPSRAQDPNATLLSRPGQKATSKGVDADGKRLPRVDYHTLKGSPIGGFAIVRSA